MLEGAGSFMSKETSDSHMVEIVTEYYQRLTFNRELNKCTFSRSILSFPSIDRHLSTVPESFIG